MADFIILFLSLAVQGTPFLILGALAGSWVAHSRHTAGLIRLIPNHPVGAAFTGAFASMLIPSCECFVIALVRRMLQKGLPPMAAMAYLLAAPVLNPVCILSTWVSFSTTNPLQMTGLRLAGALLMAVGGAIMLGGMPRSVLWQSGLTLHMGRTFKEGDAVPEPSWASFAKSFLNDFWAVATWYFVGCLLAAWLQVAMAGMELSELPVQSVVSGMLLAVLLSICSSVDAFVVKAFPFLGLSGMLAFLWIGPVLDLKLLMAYRALFSVRGIVALILYLVCTTALMAWLLEWGTR